MIVFVVRENERKKERKKEGNMNTFVRSCCEDLLQLLCDCTMKPIFYFLFFIFVGCSKRGKKKATIVH
jgi:hypothetical protein